MYLLITIGTVLLRSSLQFITLHQLHYTPLLYTCQHFTSSHLNFPQLHFTTLSFGLTLPLHFTSHHYTSLHLTSLLDDFRHTSFLFTPFVIAFLTLFLKILGLQGKVPNASTGSWFQFLKVLFTKEYFPISAVCYLSLIFRT